MSITRPTGSYARQMLDPGGWVEADEDTFYDRAQEYSQVLQRVTDVLDTCRQQKGHVFEGGLWSGGAANAANGALGANINQLMTLQDYLATVITWHRHIAGLIEQAKSDIGNNVDGAQREIDILENDPSLDADERHTAINSLVTATHGANVSLVAETAERVLESKNWKPPKNALEDLLQQKSPPPPRRAYPGRAIPGHTGHTGNPDHAGNPDHPGNPNHTHPGSAGNSDHTNARHSRHAGDPGQAGHPGDPGQTGHTRRANPDHAGHPPRSPRPHRQPRPRPLPQLPLHTRSRLRHRRHRLGPSRLHRPLPVRLVQQHRAPQGASRRRTSNPRRWRSNLVCRASMRAGGRSRGLPMRTNPPRR